jgi:hypothetical protein
LSIIPTLTSRQLTLPVMGRVMVSQFAALAVLLVTTCVILAITQLPEKFHLQSAIDISVDFCCRFQVCAGATGSAQAQPSARPHINMSENFSPHVSAKSPSNILSQPENALIRKFYQSQCAKPTKNDWCLTVQSNLETLRLSYSEVRSN